MFDLFQFFFLRQRPVFAIALNWRDAAASGIDEQSPNEMKATQ
jgi:hypothetical protein